MNKNNFIPRYLIVASHNENKVKEIREILTGVPLEIISLSQLSESFNIIEDGVTFLDNAMKKAYPVSKVYPQELVIGEDSGLEVVALGNKPGVFSRRYAGEKATDEDNNNKLLFELKNIPKEQRKAHFRCVVVLMQNGNLITSFEGRLSGLISFSPKGTSGFGYDPIFYLPEFKQTVAQLSLQQKNRISHRFQAFRQLHDFLIQYLQK